MNACICITPYRELRHGEDTLFSHVKEPAPIHPLVKQYLSLGRVQTYIPGVYRHPFTGKELIGPALLGDGVKYTWDRDTLEYAEEYGLSLPEEFISFVMSAEGFAALCRLRKLA